MKHFRLFYAGTNMNETYPGIMSGKEVMPMGKIKRG